jgi:protein-tyrosine sulfotransferase
MAAPREGLIVLGAPRSGTTLLRRLLDAHPSIACPGETHLFRACARFLEEERTGAGVDVGVLTGLGHAGFAAEDVVGRLRELAFGLHRAHARRAGKRRWAEKTAFDVFHLPAIERLCGAHVHYVCLVRHGLDVAVSVKDLCDRSGSYLLEIHEWVRRYPRPLEAFTHLWREATEELVRFAERRAEDAILVRYEDLVLDPEAQLLRILRFVGEPWEEGLVAKALTSREGGGLGDWKTYQRGRVDAESVGRWKTLPAPTLRIVAPIANPLLRQLGYEEVAVPPEEDADEARRRYELGLALQRMRKETP